MKAERDKAIAEMRAALSLNADPPMYLARERRWRAALDALIASERQLERDLDVAASTVECDWCDVTKTCRAAIDRDGYAHAVCLRCWTHHADTQGWAQWPLLKLWGAHKRELAEGGERDGE